MVGESGETDVTTAVNSIITLAEGRVEGYAAVLYDTPLPSNEMTANWALACAEWELYKNGTAFATAQEKYRQAYEDVLEELKLFSRGKLAIAGTTAPTASTRGSGPMVVLSDDVVFDDTNFMGF